jgi:type I restriction enzyme S subunit
VRNGDVEHEGHIWESALPLRWFTSHEIAKAETRDTDCILVSSGAYTGNVGRVVKDASDRVPIVVSNFVRRLRPRPETDPGWLFHALRSPLVQAQVWPHAGGSAIPNLGRSFFEHCILPVPDAAHQRTIGKVFDMLDDAIWSTERLLAKLDRMKQGLIGDLLTRGLTQGGRLRDPAIDATQFAGSDNGLLPVGWRACALDELVLNLDGRRIPLKQADRDQRHGEYRYYGASGVIDHVDDFIFDGDFILLGEDGENVVSRQLPLAFRVRGQFWVNNHAHVFSPLPDNDIRFLTHLLEHTNYSSVVIGSAQPKLTQAGLGRLRFAVPPFDEQVRIADTLETVGERDQAEREGLAKLRQLKQGLLADLLKGSVLVDCDGDAA